MSELVLLHHNEPMTTSEAIAEGVDLAHKTVIQLVRKYVSDLSEWGEVAFQMRLNHQGSPTEFAYLNEGQSMFLMTLMRNSPVVVAFKKALVNAFLEMRDRLRGDPAPQFVTSNLAHGADLAVAADRTFRSFLRAGRSAGLPMPAALRVANQQTLARTGMDMLAELAIDPQETAAAAVQKENTDPLYIALSEWLADAGEGPWRMVDILRAAVGVGPEHGAFHRLTIAAGRYLRSLGLVASKERFRGGKPANYWRRQQKLQDWV